MTGTVGGKGYIKFDLMPGALSSLFPLPQAYELSTLTGTQVLLLVASETGHVYTFATRKLQPMITSETGTALIQTCLNSPDSPPRNDPSTDQRMSATGFEETDLTYQVSEGDGCAEPTKVRWLDSLLGLTQRIAASEHLGYHASSCRMLSFIW